MEDQPFSEKITLPELQSYIRKKCIQRGFDRASDLEIYLLLTEEIGEMAKALRKKRALFEEVGRDGGPGPEDPGKSVRVQANLAEEMADVLSYLLDLANRFEVDLIKALQLKEAVNEKRTWK